MVVQHTLEELRSDVYACIFNNFYEGWKYRVASEGYDAVAKDCDIAAKEMIKQYEEKLRGE
jgi:hypothetical protein